VWFFVDHLEEECYTFTGARLEGFLSGCSDVMSRTTPARVAGVNQVWQKRANNLAAAQEFRKNPGTIPLHPRTRQLATGAGFRCIFKGL
jgi:hypothetical protein